MVPWPQWVKCQYRPHHAYDTSTLTWHPTKRSFLGCQSRRRCECGLYRVDLCFMWQLYTIIYHKLVIIIVINYISNVWCPGVNEIILKRNKIGLKFPGSNLCYSMVTKKHFTATASENSMLTHCGQISVNNGSGIDFLPGDTKPFPKPMLTYLW